MEIHHLLLIKRAPTMVVSFKIESQIESDGLSKVPWYLTYLIVDT
jgi:hypothetical protein